MHLGADIPRGHGDGRIGGFGCGLSWPQAARKCRSEIGRVYKRDGVVDYHFAPILAFAARADM